MAVLFCVLMLSLCFRLSSLHFFLLTSPVCLVSVLLLGLVLLLSVFLFTFFAVIFVSLCSVALPRLIAFFLGTQQIFCVRNTASGPSLFYLYIPVNNILLFFLFPEFLPLFLAVSFSQLIPSEIEWEELFMRFCEIPSIYDYTSFLQLFIQAWVHWTM